MAIVSILGSAVNGNIRVTAIWEAPQAVSVATADAAAHYLFDLGRGDHGTEEEPRTYDDLSNQEKLNLIAEHWTQVKKDMASSYNVNVGLEAARVAKSETEYEL